MLDLAINGIDLGRGRGGNESYLQGLIQGLEQVESIHSMHVLVGGHFGAGLPGAKTYYVQTGPYHRLSYLLWGQSLALRKLRFDWFLSTFFLPMIAPKHSALFVHDLSFLTLPKSFPVSIRLYMRWLVMSAIRRASRIFVLSNFVRSELMHYYSFVENERVYVLYPGYDACYNFAPDPTDDARRLSYNITSGYILTVSSIHPRKNLLGLLSAYQILKQNFGMQLPPLVVVGQRYWGNKALEARATALDVRLLGYIQQSDLPALYRGAGLFVYPSLYEGFGLPPIEAMACGVPVVCGDGSSLPEAVGDAAELVDMNNPTMMSNMMHNLLLSEGRRRELVHKGLQWVKRYSWQHTAEHLSKFLMENQSVSQVE